MGTRAVIAAPEGDGWKGVYHHWDGYPSGLGVTLHEGFSQFLGMSRCEATPEQLREAAVAMRQKLILDQPGGWSTINDCDLTKPGHSIRSEDKGGDAPKCYDPGDDAAPPITNTSDDYGAEYAYVIHDDGLACYSRYHTDGTKAVGWFGLPAAEEGDWKPIGKVPWHASAELVANLEG
jgi:hypothetical protein